MTMQADQSLPKDTDKQAGDKSRDPAKSPSGTNVSRQDHETPEGQTPALSEAIDRATAAVGQDDGKR